MKKSPRQLFIEKASKEPKKMAARLYDVMVLAYTHDPEHERRLAVIERQLERIGAPQYRTINKGSIRTPRKR